MAFKVDVKQLQDDVYVVKLDGRLDTGTYLFLKEKIKPILSTATKILIFDMEKLNYVSSAGLGVILEARKTIEANKGTFIMTNLQPQIKKAFKIVNGWPGKAIFKSMEEVDSYLDFMERKEIEKQKKPPDST